MCVCVCLRTCVHICEHMYMRAFVPSPRPPPNPNVGVWGRCANSRNSFLRSGRYEELMTFNFAIGGRGGFAHRIFICGIYSVTCCARASAYPGPTSPPPKHRQQKNSFLVFCRNLGSKAYRKSC